MNLRQLTHFENVRDGQLVQTFTIVIIFTEKDRKKKTKNNHKVNLNISLKKIVGGKWTIELNVIVYFRKTAVLYTKMLSS